MCHRREVSGGILLAMIMAWPLCLWGAEPELRQPQAVAVLMEVAATRIDWLPQRDYERIVLTVSGPGDLYVRQEFGPVEIPFFSALEVPDGGRLPDGSYTYELRADPRLDQEIRARLAKARETGDDSFVKDLRTRGRLPETLVQSGYFRVQGGSFVDKVPSEPVSKPPLRNVTANTTVPDDLIVQGHACIGPTCTVAGVPGLTLEEDFGGLLQIKFKPAFGGHPTANPWALQANDLEKVSGDFLIRNLFGIGKVPFRISPSAPDNALTLAFNGVGLGTLTPAVRLDVKANAAGQVAARLQNSSATGYSGIEYLDNAGIVDLFFGVDNAASTTRLNSINNNPIVILTNSTERMRINTTGATITGNLTVTGTKNFAVVDPADARQAIYYTALEGPEAGTYFRGTAKTSNGEAVIELPDYFARLTEPERLTVQLTPLGSWGQLYVAEKTPGRLVVRVPPGNTDLEFDYLVQGVRKGYMDYQVRRPNDLPR